MNSKMIIDLITVGNVKDKAINEMADKYIKMLSKVAKLNLIQVDDESNKSNINEVQKREADRILKKVDLNSYIILLDIKGHMYSSEELAKEFVNITNYHNSKITFIIGGSYGVNDEIKSITNKKISFSKLTFPHQLFKVILLEQIYRANMININHPYHK